MLLLLTLSAPHQRPPVPVAHPSLPGFYASLAASVPPTGVPLISISGGFNDTMVASELTLLHGMVTPCHMAGFLLMK